MISPLAMAIVLQAVPAPLERARANLGSYFSVDDYPSAALRAGDEGIVRFSLTVGPDGRVADCIVTESSGSAALDATTCRILRSRARYLPARDASGRPANGSDSGAVSWLLPEPAPEPVPPPQAPALPDPGYPRPQGAN